MPVLPKPVFVVVPAPPPNKLPLVLLEPKPDVALLLPKPVDAPNPVFVVVLLVDPKPPKPVDALLLELPKRVPPELLAGCPKAGFAAPKGDEVEVDPKPGERGDVVSDVMVLIVKRIIGAESEGAENEGSKPWGFDVKVLT